MTFTFKLEHPDGTLADPPTLRSAVPNWEIGDKTPSVPAGQRSRWSGVRAANDPEHNVLLVVDAA